jgi:hypothetical protein
MPHIKSIPKEVSRKGVLEIVASYSLLPMETSEWLSITTKRAYLQKMHWRYAWAQRRRYKSRLIEELLVLYGYSRKHA